MISFTSARELRFWISAAVVVALIYGTLGLATTLAGEIRNDALIGAAFWLAIWLVLGAIVVLGLKTRPGWAVVGVALGIVAVYVLVMTRIVIPEERSHLIEYGIVALLIHEALKERWGSVVKPALWAIGITAVLGLIDEIIQWFLPNRVFDWRDVGFNAGAAAMAVTASVILSSTRSWVSRRRSGTDDRTDSRFPS